MTLLKKLSYGLMYGLGLGLLSVLMVWGQYKFVVLDHATELYTLLIGVIFVVVGAWAGTKLTKPKTIVQREVVIKEVPVAAAPAISQADVQTAVTIAGISTRELEVLQLLARGMSNEEIAGQLFVSQNTVKTHLSNLYFKLEVKRRTQAVDKARSLGLIS